MAKILFRLNGVSDDEANDVRDLLNHNTIDFYDTSAGNWGVSMAAIWIKDEQQYQHARSLLDAYQNERAKRIREEFALQKHQGQHKTMFDTIRQNPVNVMVHLGLALLVIYLSAKLVIDLGF